MVELEAGPPVRGAEQGLDGAGQVHKQVAHQEEPAERRTRNADVKTAGRQRTGERRWKNRLKMEDEGIEIERERERYRER